MPYFNYLGVAMPESGTETGNISGTSLGNETVQAPAGNTSVSGEGGGDLLVGSSGDNRIWITNSHDRVSEQAGGGIDTEIGWTSIKLAPNVENLIVHQDFNYAVGNDLDNLIIVDGSQWVVGGRGNDVLVGSTTQKTSFTFHAGDGNDVVYNWNGNSQLQLTGYGLDTAAFIHGAMTQQGSDVLLRLSSTESVTFRGTTVAAFTDRQLLTALDQSKLGAMTFNDEFNSLQIYNPSTGTGQWQTNFGGNLKDQWAYTLVSNGETQAYVAPGFQGRGEQDIEVNPFSVSNGVLTITAAPVSQDDAYSTWNRDYTSGMLNTYGSFAQKYGYFEMRAELPTAVGSWPAFWMLPHPYQANAEADIMEALAATPNIDYRHAGGGVNGSEGLYDNVYKADPTGFHTYGMMWTAEKLTFYYDGVAVLTGATPSTWTSPMAMIVNLATGGWGGATNGAQFPAQLNIDYVRAYALADGSSTVVASTPERPVDTLIDEGPASGRTPVTETFSDGTPVSSAHIQISGSHPTALPPGKTFMIWEDSGAVFGAVSDGTNLAPSTVLMAGTASQFTGSGTWLTTGKLVFSYYMPNASGGHDLWDMVFDPVRKTFVRQDLGAAAPDAHAVFVATEVGGFAVSWHAPDGTVVARGYDEWAYGGDIPGWYGPTRQITGDLIGVASQGKVIAANGAGQEIYTLYQASAQQAPGVGFASGAVTHAEGDSGAVAFDYTITRSGPTDAAGSVVWTVTGTGVHPADAADFQGGSMPQGVVNFAAGEATRTITVPVAGDGASESDETFTVTLSNAVGGTVTTATANGTITNDDGSTGGSTGGGSTGGGAAGGQVLTASGPGATLTGGAGNDTLNSSQGQDQLTGGAGADTFAFANSNWAPAHITDFTLGTDKLDLSVMLQKAGVTASDPVAAHYISFLDDGAGGTKLLFDSDASGNNPQWPSYVIQLDHVSSTGLTWSALTGGAAGGGSSGGGTSTPPAGGGAFIVFAGQSNMGAPYQDASTVTSRWSPDPLALIWNDTSAHWEQMNPGVNTGYGGATSGWGPEVEFAIDFRASHPGETLRIVKSVFGGTILAKDDAANHADWSPQSSGELFAQTTQLITRASAAAGGIAPTLAFWGQGEEDANYQASASAYGGNLSALFTAIRLTWLHDASGRIGFFQIGNSPPYSAQVRAGEQSVDQADPNATSFDSAGYALQADGLHFAASGLNAAGDAFFQFYQGWMGGAAGGGSSGGGSGQVITSPGPGSTLTGGAGNDTLIASQGQDQLIGGASADVFSFPAEPWAPARITDFVLGTDRLDLSSLLQKSGFTGSDPVAAHYITFLDDGAGGTKLLFDHDGTGASPQWPNYILQLDHVSATGLTWAALSTGGSTTGGSTGGGTTGGGTTGGGTTGGSTGTSGQVMISSGPGATLTGGAGNDTLNASQGQDQLTGGAGADIFAFSKAPWAPAHIIDFVLGTDKLDFSAVLQAAGYTGSDPVGAHYISFLDDGAGGTKLLFDPDGTGANPQWPNYVIQLDHLSSTGLTWSALTGGAAGGGSSGGSTGGGSTGGSIGTSGQVLTSPGPGVTLTGGAGNDTLNASQGQDQLTGGAGADSFVFSKAPWAPAHITDFVLGTDKLDFSGALQAAGYTGSDPVGAKYIAFMDDGAGGTKLLFDPDGAGNNPQWPNYVVQLDHVSSVGLTWSALTGGAAAAGGSTGGGSTGGGGGTTGSAGQVLMSGSYGATLTGGSGNDTLNAGQGPDVLSGGGGGDHFAFKALPWNAGHITDFVHGADKLDLSALFQAAGYRGTDPVADRYLSFTSDGAGGTRVMFDSDGPAGGNPWPTTIVTLDHVAPSTLTSVDWII